MPIAMSVVWSVIKDKELGNKEKYGLLLDFDKILGFDIESFGKEKVPEEVLKLVEERERAREQKAFKKADELRDEIKTKGYVVEDTPHGPRVKKL
jgi:cysteinyl-tRNA synthetase